jgi:hypothetical protein
MTVAIVALLYHWVITGDFTAESVIIPLIGSAALLALILAYIAQDRDALAAENAAAKAVTPEKN